MRLAFIEVQSGTQKEQVLRFEVEHITSSDDEEQIIGDIIVQLRSRLDRMAAVRRERERMRSEVGDLYAKLGYPNFEVPSINLSVASFGSDKFSQASLDTLLAIGSVLREIQGQQPKPPEDKFDPSLKAKLQPA